MEDKVLKDMSEKMDHFFKNITPEQIQEMKDFFKDDRPKGWLSIEDHLPYMFAIDVMQGYSVFKVRYADGTEGTSPVADHNTWYYRAKGQGITHWLNEEHEIPQEND